MVLTLMDLSGWERMMKLLSDPTGLLRDVYQWGNSGFDGLALFTTLQTLLRGKFGIPAGILRPSGAPAMLEAFGFNAEVNPAVSPPGLDVGLRTAASDQFYRDHQRERLAGQV